MSPAKQPISKMDAQILIQKLSTGQGADYGEATERWTDYATVWANVYSGSGRELEMARQISAEIDTQFQIRWIDGMRTTMRIIHEGRAYDIKRIQEIGRRDRLNIFATARQI
jgi:SPP1 family predicted phage head-tail adaptor